MTAVTDYEVKSKEYETGAFNNWMAHAGIENYDTGVLIAYNHGLPDGNSGWDVSGTHVTEATANVIRIAGQNGPNPIDGFFDRGTGHGEITWYQPGEKPGSARVHKMFLLQCEPSKAAKF
jgi:hypothetical protein